MEEPVEPPLREHDGPHELAVVESEEFFDPLVDQAVAIDLLAGGAALQLVDRRRSVAMARPSDGPLVSLGEKRELDRHRVLAVGDELFEIAAAGPGLAAVQRQAQRLDDRGLAGPGVADDGEEVEITEVDLGGFSVGPQPSERELDRPHGRVAC